MAIFLYSYDDPSHYQEATRYGVVGARKTESESLNSRFPNLHRDDWIVLRDSSLKGSLVILGCHRVLADAWAQSVESPYLPLLWPDEKAEGRVLYEFRVPVDPRSIPCTGEVEWGELDFGATNKSKEFLETRGQWAALFRGNFVTGEHAPATFLEVLGLPASFLEQVG